MTLFNKRYRDIFEQYIYKEESTPLTIGTLAVCVFCFLLLIIATFTETSVTYPYINFDDSGVHFFNKTLSYTPRIPVMIFIIYLLGRSYSLFVFFLYLIVGFFIWPIFVFGGGLSYIQNYLFGYFLGFLPAIFITGSLLSISQNFKAKIIAGILGVLSIHLSGFLYCIVLALFGVISYNMIFPIVHTISGTKILYDLFFSIAILLVGPYIKNIFWVCMKPKADKKKRPIKNQISEN